MSEGPFFRVKQGDIVCK